ncbi:hypothetical protein [Streptomyces sp. NPDC056387]|uniref:hypothetical protein n=1 Tax=Streptomyces sp. NPDC056387 TaxID=3345803 RepID=UPI0035D7CBCA
MPGSGGDAVPLTAAALEASRPVTRWWPLGPVAAVFTEEGPGAQLLAPAVAPDGRRTAWLRTTPAPEASCVLAGDLAAQPPRWTAAGELLVTVDGRFTLVRPERPQAHFDALVRTSAVLRGGVPRTADELVAGFAPAPGRRTDLVHWDREQHLMLRDGCCRTPA